MLFNIRPVMTSVAIRVEEAICSVVVRLWFADWECFI